MKNRAYRAYCDALLELLEFHEYNDLSVTNIVNKAGYGRSGFYGYFHSKDNLRDHIVNREVSLYTDVLSESLSAHIRDKRDNLGDILIDDLTHVYHSRLFYKALLSGKFPNCNADCFVQKVIDLFNKQDKYEPIFLSKEIDKEFFYFISAHHFFEYIQFWESKGFDYPLDKLAEQILYYLDETGNHSLLKLKEE